MQSKYYYLVATLPYLFFDTKSPISTEHFLSECERWLSRGDFQIIRHIDMNNIHIRPEDPGLVKEWKRFNIDLREELGKIRAIKIFHPEEKITSRFKDIFEEETPLDMEKRFERMRWDYIEEREFLYRFDINWLVLYLLKLQILERMAAFNKEEGLRVFDELCEVR